MNGTQATSIRASWWRGLWPSLEDAAGARRAARHAMWVAVLCATLTAVFAPMGPEDWTAYVGVDEFGLVGTGMFYAIAWGLSRHSRFAAWSGLTIYAGPHFYNWGQAWSQGHSSAAVTVAPVASFILIFVGGVRGTMALHSSSGKTNRDVLRLNGWQRLWVVLVALIAIMVATVAALKWPQADSVPIRAHEFTQPTGVVIKLFWYGAEAPTGLSVAAINAILNPAQVEPKLIPKIRATVREAKGLTDAEILEAVREGRKLSSNPIAIDEAGELVWPEQVVSVLKAEGKGGPVYFPSSIPEELVAAGWKRLSSGFAEERRQIVIKAALSFAAISLGFYVIGAVAAWVKRGFRTATV